MSNTLFRIKRSAVKGKAPVTSNLEVGELALNTNDGRLFFKTVDSSSTQSVITLTEPSGGTGITYAKNTGDISITNTGVTAGQYGTSSTIPVLTVNEQGQITAMDSVSVAGVSSFTFDSANATLTIGTADGGSFDARIGLVAFDTDDLSEGSTNKYYLKSRVDSDFTQHLGSIDADIIPDTDSAYDLGSSTNKFKDLYLSGSSIYLGSLVISDINGVLSVKDSSGGSAQQFDLSANSTDDLTEGSTNKYYQKDRVDSDFDLRLSNKSTSDLTEGSNLYYTTARADSDAKNAISVTDAGGDGSLTYNAGTGVITYTGPSASETRAHFSGGTGVTITDGVVSIAQSVGTTDDVVFGKVTVDSAQVDCLHLSKLVSAPNSLRGLLYYDSDPQKGLSFIPTTNELVEDVTINLGQEHLIYVHNLTGAQINNGQAVYISGVAHGAHPQVTLAKADAASTARPIGLATMDIPDGAHGYVTSHGLVRDVNTLGMTAGGVAYLSKDSAGEWSTTEVSVDSGYPTHIGTILTVDSAQGTILVNIEPEHFEYLNVQDKIVVGDELVAPDIYSSHIHFDGKAPEYYAEGLIYYDSANGALVVKNDEEDVTLQVGQEEWIRVYNNSGADITNGTPVYISGTANNLPSIEEADATFSYGSVGVATHTIENGTVGYVTSRGIVNDINTQGLTVGSKIHVGVGGGLTETAPEYPYYPTDLGVCLVQDSVAGQIYVDIIDHTMETLRVTQDARFDANVTIGGNLNVIGVTTSVISQELTTSGNLLQLLDGDTVGTAYQNTGGLDDATFKGKYTGDSDVFYFVRMTSVDSAGVGDAIEWGISDSDQMLYGSYNGQYGYGKSFDSDASGITNWNLKDDGLTAPLRNGLSIQFINLSGHDSADVWCAHPTELNLDLGVIGNYNQANKPLKYAGVVRDATDERWKFFDSYPSQSIGAAGTQFDINFDSASLSDIQFATAYGNLSGNATSANTATQLTNARTIGLTGDITATGVSFNGTSNITLTTAIGSGVIVNADISASANISDAKLDTISTAGKVQNSATTATANNTASAIVTRDVSGNFSAGTITASLTGNVTGNLTGNVSGNVTGDVTGNLTGNATSADSADNADTLDGEHGSYYRINVYNSSGTLLN